MQAALDPALVLVLLLNFFVLGTSRLGALIRATAAQGALLAGVALLAHGEIGAPSIAVAAGAVLFKAVVIPWTLLRAVRDVAIRADVEPFIGFKPSLLIGALGTGLAILLARNLPLAPEHAESLLIPTALATVLTGFIVMVTRKKAITQVVGYLVLENGVFIMGMSLVEAMPFLVEMGVLLDLVVGIFVMGIMINHIQREFSSVDTDRLSQLKE